MALYPHLQCNRHTQNRTNKNVKKNKLRICVNIRPTSLTVSHNLLDKCVCEQTKYKKKIFSTITNIKDNSNVLVVVVTVTITVIHIIVILLLLIVYEYRDVFINGMLIKIHPNSCLQLCFCHHDTHSTRIDCGARWNVACIKSNCICGAQEWWFLSDVKGRVFERSLVKGGTVKV